MLLLSGLWLRMKANQQVDSVDEFIHAVPQVTENSVG
jgi:hypothetical protein